MALISLFPFFGLLISAQVVKCIQRENFFNTSGIFLNNTKDDGSTDAIPLKENFKFFGTDQSNAFVSYNGVLSFIKGVIDFTANCTHADRNNKFVAPFWADIDIRRNGNITYRQSEEQVDIDQANLRLVTSFPKYSRLQMKWIFTVTYKDVSYHKRQSRTGVTNTCDLGDDTGVNTFQVTLTTDGIHSFVILYYEKIQWTSGMASGGDCTGNNGKAAKVGFDMGDVDEFLPIEGSCTNEVKNLPFTSNAGEAGVWIWRVDDIELKSPLNDFPIPSEETEVEQPIPEPPNHETPETPTIDPIPTPPESGHQCPPQNPIPPCRQLIIDIIDVIIEFVREFPRTCLVNSPSHLQF